MIATRSRRLSLLTGAVLVGMSVVMAAASAVAPSDSNRSDHFWRLLTLNGIEAEHYDSLAEMSRKAEAVVVGTIQGVGLSRTFGGSDDAEPVRLGALSLHVTKTVAGRLVTSGDTLTLEVTLPGGTTIEELRATVPDEETIFFVRNKGTEVAAWGWSKVQVAAETAYYRLVSSQGTIRNIDGRAVVPVASEDDFLTKLHGESFVDVIGAVATAAP